MHINITYYIRFDRNFIPRTLFFTYKLMNAPLKSRKPHAWRPHIYFIGNGKTSADRPEEQKKKKRLSPPAACHSSAVVNCEVPNPASEPFSMLFPFYF